VAPDDEEDHPERQQATFKHVVVRSQPFPRLACHEMAKEEFKR
jgi:hypothetical protein